MGDSDVLIGRCVDDTSLSSAIDTCGRIIRLVARYERHGPKRAETERSGGTLEGDTQDCRPSISIERERHEIMG